MFEVMKMKRNSPNTPFPIRKYYGVMIVGFAIFLAFMAYYSVKFKEKRDLAKQEVKLNESVVNSATQGTTATTAATTSATTESTETMSQPTLTYNETTKLQWPTTGNILMPYSTTSTVYFETLDQYRINPGILIEAKEGSDVKAVKEARVEDVRKTSDYGQTITLDIGGGYSAVFGQLKNVSVKTGQSVKAGQVIAQVNAPTDYFTLEGTHLFYEMMKDKKPVNPTNYLK